MSIKTQLLNLLENSKGAYVSGGALAAELSVSRNAVWKAIESLRTDGYEITAVTNKGYCLKNSGDVLSAEGIMSCLKHRDAYRLEVRKSVTSTNTVLAEMAAEGLPEGFVIAAEEQTRGKGRQGRSFYSPAGHGVYFSLLLRPFIKAEEAAFITSAAAVAAAQAIETVTGVQVGIKWVNDLFADGKKVCGILTEASFDMESGAIDSAVLGIGINLTEPKNGYPAELKEIAAALSDVNSQRESIRNRLIAAILDNFWVFYKNLSEKCFLDEYRMRSIIIGREIEIIRGDKKTAAHAVAIDDECRLVVRYENGEETVLNSGEVSIRRFGI